MTPPVSRAADDDRCLSLADALSRRFGPGEPPRFFRAPGRVDLLGSHTDYNQGLVLAAAVNRDILAAARPRTDGQFCFYSLNLDSEVRVAGPDFAPDRRHGWANYGLGVLKELRGVGIALPGLDLAVHGNLPVGANLSSSAALEAAVCTATLGLAGATMERWAQIHLCRRAETDFVGVPCGLLDQFTVFMGRRNQALFLDCRSLESGETPFPAERASLVVADSGVGRELVSSRYAERVDECRAAVQIFRSRRPEIKSLRDVTEDDIEACRTILPENLLRRARHVVGENRRVKQAILALEQSDPAAVGRIMEQGYQSCRDDYDNSTPELDALHDLLAAAPGVLGVRIAGAGWGGCLAGLSDPQAVDNIKQSVPARYQERTGREARIWAVETANGPGERVMR